VFWFWLGLVVLLSMPALVAGYLVKQHFNLRWNYLHHMVRIFQEKPLFIVPRGQPVAGAEDLTLRTADGLTLHGCYLKGAGRRRGVIWFGLEFGSNRWACAPYCEQLLAAGYDVFALETRGQGDSDPLPGYDPLQWVTEYEVRDMEAALAYLKGRPDADPRGVGFFGISKGGGAGLFVAARDPYVRCCVTDGIFATYTTLIPYMRHWFRIYNNNYVRQAMFPSWYYGCLGLIGLGWIEAERHCRFPHLEPALRRLKRPLLMIHGGADTYIKPDMARALFDMARSPKVLWLVPEAKHNQAFHLAGEEYGRRVLEFFDRHLGAGQEQPAADDTPPPAQHDYPRGVLKSHGDAKAPR
jgi:pimeloyl-ACP methyl ester carboxylesterase